MAPYNPLLTCSLAFSLHPFPAYLFPWLLKAESLLFMIWLLNAAVSWWAGAPPWENVSPKAAPAPFPGFVTQSNTPSISTTARTKTANGKRCSVKAIQVLLTHHKFTNQKKQTRGLFYRNGIWGNQEALTSKWSLLETVEAGSSPPSPTSAPCHWGSRHVTSRSFSVVHLWERD